MKRIYRMNKNEISKPRRQTYGWLLIIFGIGLFVAGILMRAYSPSIATYSHLLEGLGILVFGWGIVPAIRDLSSRLNPSAARRDHLVEGDERGIAIRNQAAFSAFIFANATTGLTLIVYSALTRGQPGFDPLWYALAFLVIAPIVVYIVIYTRLNR